MPRPKPSTPALFEMTVRSLTRESRKASISASGMPHSPKPPTASSWPSRTTPASAAAALGKILFMKGNSNRRAKARIISAARCLESRAHGHRHPAEDPGRDRRGVRAAAEAARRVDRCRRRFSDSEPAGDARARSRRRSAVRAGDHVGGGYGDAGGDDRKDRRVQADDDGAVAGELLEAGAEGGAFGDREGSRDSLREDAQLRGRGVPGAGWEGRGACDNDVRIDLTLSAEDGRTVIVVFGTDLTDLRATLRSFRAEMPV